MRPLRPKQSSEPGPVGVFMPGYKPMYGMPTSDTPRHIPLATLWRGLLNLQGKPNPNKPGT